MELEACNLRMVKGQSQSESSFTAMVILQVWSGLVWSQRFVPGGRFKSTASEKVFGSLSRAIFLK